MKSILLFGMMTLRCCWDPSEYQLMQYAQNDDAILKTLDGKYEIHQLLNEDVSEFGLNIKFDSKENKVTGFSGCNRFFGSYVSENGSLKFSDLGTTRMLCSDDKNNIETKFLKALDKADTVLFSENGFTAFANKKPLISATKRVEENVMSIEYYASSRGRYRYVEINKDSISFSKKRGEKITNMPCDKAYWGSLLVLCNTIDFENMANLEAPSKSFQFDGAPLARLKIIANGETFESVPFDHYNPPKEVAVLVNKIVSLMENIE
ncbi:META domain-containing protein [Hyunsoonleella sp. SJ7]|uniref:META domain-containing protein n=1 Tax=Hyunsoonleella aquatilis TaxID=2762758 RepID=A0A923H8D1_9FLAO|nr:META domain-containing protein [Hyunsoonleella aquatilis]MBC3758275.1 META domain-containing protein [Hyunsoonleella aquatilis]